MCTIVMAMHSILKVLAGVCTLAVMHSIMNSIRGAGHTATLLYAAYMCVYIRMYVHVCWLTLPLVTDCDHHNHN